VPNNSMAGKSTDYGAILTHGTRHLMPQISQLRHCVLPQHCGGVLILCVEEEYFTVIHTYNEIDEEKFFLVMVIYIRCKIKVATLWLFFLHRFPKEPILEAKRAYFAFQKSLYWQLKEPIWERERAYLGIRKDFFALSARF